ncbi:MAG: serine hydroxymethyltransferase [Patescibacteria group bacterium]
MKQQDKIFNLIKSEEKRQTEQLQMIPSENYVSENVKKAVGSVLMNKYSEGQPTKRYYQGNKYIDEIELEAKKRALKLFKLNADAWDVNVQAPTGSSANLAVYFALLEPGNKMLSMYLYDGGHLSHGWKLPDGKKVSMTSKIFSPVYYQVDPSTMQFDYENVEQIAQKTKPELIISGGTAYPRQINHKKMGKIAKKMGAYYMADIAHEAGLVAAGVNDSPFEYADIVTMTTRKTLRGPIGALIFSKKELSERIDKTVFPGLQGGPMNHSIAGIAVALKEAQSAKFKKYATQVIKNAQILSEELMKHELNVITGGTDKHLLLINLQNKNTDGWYAAWALEYAGIICNRNTVAYDTGSPFYPSGLRLGTPAITTRGMKEREMRQIAHWINEVVNIAINITPTETDKPRKVFKQKIKDNKDLKTIENEVKQLCKNFPLP